MSLPSDSRSSLEELKRRNLPPGVPVVPPGEPSAQTKTAPVQTVCPTVEEWQKLRQILWTMGEVLGEQTVILEELSQCLTALPRWEQIQTMNRETASVRSLMEQEQKELTAIRQLLVRQGKGQDGKKRGRRFSARFLKTSMPRPSLGWLFLPLILAALWALWYGWGVLWSALNPVFT